jgi:flagellar L-ring protein precursor FlgH
MRTPLNTIVLLLLALMATGCATTAPQSDPGFAASRPPAPLPPQENNGGIYQVNYGLALFQDTRARRVGDVLTVLLIESTNASKSASTSTERSNEIELGAANLFGRTPTFHGKEVLGVGVSTSQGFEGGGDSSQSNRLDGSVTVSVHEVMANGYLVVRGEKILTLNQGTEYVRFSGIVRPSDIRADNTVFSTQVADTKISYSGEGAVADANAQGWLSRFFMMIWPF